MAEEYKDYLKGLGKAVESRRQEILKDPAYDVTKYEGNLKDYKKLGIKNEDALFKIRNAGKDAAAYAAKAAKATRIGKIAGAVAAAGITASAFLRSKMKDIKEKQRSEKAEGKMGGGMMNKYSEGKSVRGYGKARKSGMGLQDESVSLGKGADYIKDLI